jgi:hypothetical protein
MVDKDEFDWPLSRSRTKVHFFQELQQKINYLGTQQLLFTAIGELMTPTVLNKFII